MIWSKAIGGVVTICLLKKIVYGLLVQLTPLKFKIMKGQVYYCLMIRVNLKIRWEISGKAWFIFVKNKTAFVGLSGRNGYGELKVGFSAKYIELENDGSIIAGDYSKIDEICLGHSNGGITIFG